MSWTSIRARYRPTRPIALLHAVAAVLDVVVYASATYFVVHIVFQRGGFERFELILIGFIAFTWTVRSMLEARNFVELRDRMSEASDHPIAATVAASLAPPTFTFLVSLAVAIVIEVAVLGTAERLSAVAWLAPAVLIHLVLNIVLLLALGVALARRWIAGVVPVVIATAVVWMLSPVMYRFEDIPEPASALLTHLNPASHLLAAYHNALWRAEPMSLKVLPAACVLGIILIAWLARLAAAPRPVGAAKGTAPGNGPHLVAASNGAPPALGPGSVYTRWTATVGGLTGEDLTTLIVAARGGRARGSVVEIGAGSDIGRLFTDSIAIYPPWALAQLAFATAMAGDEPELVLDGILDEVRPAYLAGAWARLEREAQAGRRIVVVTYTAMTPPLAPRRLSG